LGTIAAIDRKEIPPLGFLVRLVRSSLVNIPKENVSENIRYQQVIERKELVERCERFETALNFIAGYSARRGVKVPNGSTKVIERVAEAALVGDSIADAAARQR
jgi:hypothetical protein